MRSDELAGSVAGLVRIVGVALATLGFAAAAGASELKIPRDRPQVAFDVPDGWTIERSAFAVEMRSPEKNSVVLASVLADRSTVDAWTKEAGEKLKAFGIQFDTNAKAPEKPAQAANQDKDDDKKADADAKSAFTTSPDAFTFSGAPSLKPPGTDGSNKPVKPADNSIEGLTGFGSENASKPKPKLPFKAVQIFGTTLNGKPVDVQVVIYALPANHLFVMMQESGSDDGRAVAMAQSVRRAK